MQSIPKEFHTEEYKQIRSEVVGLVEKVDQYFRYTVLVPTGAYSWLIATSFGTHSLPVTPTIGTSCLKVPLALAILAWLIPPLFVLACGLIVQAFGTRISQMGEYLLQLENALGAQNLGWEKYNFLLAPDLTKSRKRTWTIILSACTVASISGILTSVCVGTYCIAK